MRIVEEVALVAEISSRIHADDLKRAINRSNIARKVFPDRRVIPGVIGSDARVIRDQVHSGVWLVEKNHVRELTEVSARY